jgi:hypothetical protein
MWEMRKACKNEIGKGLFRRPRHKWKDILEEIKGAWY